MEEKDIKTRIKKYFFFISILFIILIWIHLSYIFLYSDSKEEPEIWGKVIEWVIWEEPHLNPLKTTDDYNDTLNKMLYRSLLKYKADTKQIEWDIANCDILSSNVRIECTINDNALWSNWEKISYEDILFTYKTLKEREINKQISKILEDVEIELKENSIVFKNTKKDKDWHSIEDINILAIFFQAIIPSSLWKDMKWDNLIFSPINGIYSGEYILSNLEKDETLWIKKYILTKNAFYKENPAYIEKYIFYLFNDMSHFLKNKNIVNIFRDDNNILTSSLAKLEEYKYSLNKYSSIFVNTLKINDKNLRKIILNACDNKKLVEILGENNFKYIDSVFLDEVSLKISPTKSSLWDILKIKWYYNKDNLSNILKEKITKQLNVPLDNNKIKDIKLEENEKVNSNNYLSKSKIFYEPTWIDNYNFISKNDILLKWNTTKDTSEIFINDIKIIDYKAWNTNFSYKLSESLKTLKKWENTYKIYFLKADWKKELVEEISMFYDTNKKNQAKNLDNLIIRLNKNKLDEKIKKIISTPSIDNNLNQAQKEAKFNDIQLSIDNLDKRFFYNEKLEAYTINLYYIQENEESTKIINLIKKQIEDAWIKVNDKWFKIKEFLEELDKWKKDYDIFIWNIDFSYFSFNLFPYIHSSQIRNSSKLNFSNFTTKDTDIISEKLKTKLLAKEERLKLENELNKILWEEAIIKPLYSKYNKILIDKNIHWYKISEYIPSKKYLFDPFLNSFIQKKRNINYENKNLNNFIKYIISSLF